jgi:hypothetical protein
LERPIGIIHRQRKTFTPTAMKFIELLKAQQGDQAPPADEAETVYAALRDAEHA